MRVAGAMGGSNFNHEGHMSIPRSPSFGPDVGRDERGRFIKLHDPLGQVGVQLSCPRCIKGDKRIGWHRGRVVHRLYRPPLDLYEPCPDYDEEGRHVSEAIGWFEIAWWPVRCRNGKLRWLRWVERHDDGSYSLGNRAH